MGLRVVLFLTFALYALGQHDHGRHVDAEFITGEAARVAYNPIENILNEIKIYQDDLGFIEEKYNSFLQENDPVMNEELQKIWEKNFEPNYRELVDRIIILSSVCYDVYNDENCKVPEEFFSGNIDGRDEVFRQEFMDEVHNALEGIVAKIKTYSRDRRPSDL